MLSALSSHCFRGEGGRHGFTYLTRSFISVVQKTADSALLLCESKASYILGRRLELFVLLFLPENLFKQQLLPPSAIDDQ